MHVLKHYYCSKAKQILSLHMNESMAINRSQVHADTIAPVSAINSHAMLCYTIVSSLAVLSLTRAAQPLLQNVTSWELERENIIAINSNFTKCPTWYVPSTEDPDRCMCGDTLMNAAGKVVECHGDQRVSLLINYCMSYNESTRQTLVAHCLYVNAQNKTPTYILQPQNQSDLNSELCDWANREGFMCHKCRSGLGVSVLSYDRKCVKCLGKLKGWTVYFILATVPTTLFFVLVITCRIRATAANMNGILCMLQIWSVFSERDPRMCNQADGTRCRVLKASLTIGGVWNLDFLRLIVPSFCITENLGILDVVAMEYIIGLYPLVLIITTCIFIQLHDRGCKPVVILWTPFRLCFSRLSGNVDLRSSIIDAFATFLLLTYSKLIFVSYNLMSYTALLNPEGQRVGDLVTFSDATIPYLSKQHLPYFVLSLSILAVFILLPMIFLFLYPTRTFQRILGLCQIQWHPLHSFADAFNGCYKNGTDGTRDYRYFGAVYLLVRILLCLPQTSWKMNLLFLHSATYSTAAVMFAICRPYKNEFFNIFDCLLFAVLSQTRTLLTYHYYVFPAHITEWFDIIYSVPMVYLFIYTVHKSISFCAPDYMDTAKKLFKMVMKRKGLRLLLDGSVSLKTEDPVDEDIEADRVLNPAEYQGLVKTGKPGTSTLKVQSSKSYGTL